MNSFFGTQLRKLERFLENGHNGNGNSNGVRQPQPSLPTTDILLQGTQQAVAVAPVQIVVQANSPEDFLENGDMATPPGQVPPAGGLTLPYMDSAEFRNRGKEMVDYISDYMDTIGQRRVTPAIEPGYLRERLPEDPPMYPEDWDEIMDDVEQHIMPGVTHWQHPRFHAYFPSGNSYPSIMADMLSDAIGSNGFSWAASPVYTELETIVMDWLGRMVGLPKEFLPFTENGKGGGVIQGSASECILVSLLAARQATIRELKRQHPFVEEGVLLSKLMAYCSKEAHSSVEKAAMIAFVKIRILETDDKYALRGSKLAKAIQEDRSMGLIPFFVSSTLGTTSCCSFDPLTEIGPICKEENVWLHVDAAYAGNAFICPQFRYLMKGIEYATSFNFNPNKWMLVNFDCSTMWVTDRFKLTEALIVDPLYLKHSHSDRAIDYRHWGIPLSRRFRSLKLWFVIRSYGVEGLRRYILEHCRLAKRLEALIKLDSRFEIMNQVTLGLVCFRLHGNNTLNEKFLSSINASGKLHMVPASLNERYVIRFCVCSQTATDDDIDHAWHVITQMATDILQLMVKDQAETQDEIEREAEESVDEVFVVDKRNRMSISQKRSFFVRMVSDPKCYNPKIVRTLSMTSRRNLSDSDTGVQTPI
ncbi:Tyrosine decarboxylase [Hypsibius exemplaris]|uniref:Tyrosine decarboxylase n=1 Tax=Hypsibius exemplaris TaxID=2072580 RepID=A0A1W0WSW7_HYPEX|nr:Tyrosine decarboxylase [Hypsibius exemplaris]